MTLNLNFISSRHFLEVKFERVLLTLNQALDQKSSNKAGIPAHSILHCYLHGLVNEDRLYSFSSSEVSFLASAVSNVSCSTKRSPIIYTC